MHVWSDICVPFYSGTVVFVGLEMDPTEHVIPPVLFKGLYASGSVTRGSWLLSECSMYLFMPAQAGSFAWIQWR